MRTLSPVFVRRFPAMAFLALTLGNASLARAAGDIENITPASNTTAKKVLRNGNYFLRISPRDLTALHGGEG